MFDDSAFGRSAEQAQFTAFCYFNIAAEHLPDAVDPLADKTTGDEHRGNGIEPAEQTRLQDSPANMT